MAMKRTVTIETYTVGQAFGTKGLVRRATRPRRILHTTRLRPFGQTGGARSDATQWATTRGYTVVEAEP